MATMKYLHLFILWSVLVGAIHAEPVTPASPAPLPVLRLAADTPQVSASGALSLLRTRSREVDPAHIANMGTWQAISDNVSLGYSSDVIWLSMTVMRDALAPDQWILGVDNALLGGIQIFYRQPDGDWMQIPTGSSVHSAWLLDVRTPSFPLTLPAGETRLLIRLHSKHSLTAEIKLWQRDAFDNDSRRDVLYYGLYFGGFLLLMILHGFFLLLNKQKQSGWYLLYLTPIAVMQLLTLGIPQWLFLLPQKIVDPLLGCSIGAALIIGAKLAASLLDLPSRYPRASKLFIDASVLPGIASVLLILAGYDAIGLILVQSATLVYLMATIGLSIYLLCRGYRPARFFVFFFGIYYAAIAISFLCDLGLVPPNTLTLNVFYCGSLIHMLGMSMRMYFQFTLLRQQVADAKDLAVQTIRRRNEGLEAEVAARTIELQQQIAQRTQLADDLRTALTTERRIREEQRSFVAMVSHEFRTPLAIINMTAQQIARNPGAPWHEVQQRCQNLRDTVRRMMNLVEDYLSVDRMDMQTPIFSPRPCCLSQLIDGLIWQWPQGRVSILLQDVPEAFFCDPGLLKIALQNLLNNADRHAPPGEVIEFHAKMVEEHGLQMDVRNGGEPIPLEEVPHLFQKYFRGRMAQQHTGAGLGLYLVKQIADMHGGSAWIENAGQQGKIIFSLFLPGRSAAAGALP